MPDLRLAAIAAHRFGLGPRPGELRTIAGDPRGWVKSQLGRQSILPAPIAALPRRTIRLRLAAGWAAGLRGRTRGAWRPRRAPGRDAEELGLIGRFPKLPRARDACCRRTA
jgi:hypothetical protein